MVRRAGSLGLKGGAAVLASVGALIGSAGLARAQYANDKPLDRNLQRGSGGYNPARASLADELRFRNAVVTGNSAGGFSFRGNVGYRAPGEFLGTLGSNDTFAFRRDSYVSGLGGLGIRGTDALQYQFAMTTGNAPPSAFNGVPLLHRSNSGELSASVNSPGGERQSRAGEFSRDVAEGRLSGARQTAAYTSNRVFQPTFLGAVMGQDGRPVGVTASPLRGINTTALQGEREPLGAPPAPANPPLPGNGNPPAANPTNNPQAAPAREGRDGQPASPAGPTRVGNTAAAERNDTRISTAAPSDRGSYQVLIDRMTGMPVREPTGTGPREPGTTAGAGRAGEATGPGEPGRAGEGERPSASGEKGGTARDDFEQRMSEMRDILAGRPPRARQTDTAKAARPGEGLRPQGAPGEARATGEGGANGEGQTRRAGERAAAEGPEDKGAPDANDLARRRGTIEMLRRAGQVGTLAPAGFDAYATSMKQAQDLLASGRYFDAEERFTTALGVRPGDPMAAAGRVHAELGSAMFLSAALNLRELLTHHPEMMGVRYAPELMPSKDRTGKVKDRLQELLDAPGGRPRDMGLLLAYLGHQTGDAAAQQRGLDAMLAEGGEAENRRLGELLREVWANRPAPQGAAQPAPPQPGTKPAAGQPAPGPGAPPSK
jgi:hypothetical protein